MGCLVDLVVRVDRCAAELPLQPLVLVTLLLLLLLPLLLLRLPSWFTCKGERTHLPLDTNSSFAVVFTVPDMHLLYTCAKGILGIYSEQYEYVLAVVYAALAGSILLVCAIILTFWCKRV